MASINLTGYSLTFDEEFNTRSISQTGQGTTWADIRSQWRYDANSDIGFGHSSFVDPASGYDPFRVEGGALAITAVPDRTKFGYPGSWESGLITTQGNFSQTYGYFEIRANFSSQVGSWDAFWLLPDKQIADPYNAGKWQELDIVEHYGGWEKGVYSTIHTTDSQNGVPWQNNRQVYSEMSSPSGYHTYGMNWQADYISFYVDGKLVGKQLTPSDMHRPMYLLVNLATQGADHSTNNADATGVPISSSIDYVRVFSNDPNATDVRQHSVSAPDGQDPGLYGATIAPIAKYTSGNSIIEINKLSFGTVISDPLSAGGKVYALYDGLLGRAPDAGGFASFTTALNGGTNLHDVTANILASPEAQQHLNASDNSAFVEQLYETVLGRQGDVGGRNTWTTQLNNGASRADVADGFVFSQEHSSNLQSAFQNGIYVPDAHAADVARLYYGLLDRAPDAGGLQNFTNAVNNSGWSSHDVAQAMLNSPEYKNLMGNIDNSVYVWRLYDNALGRHPEAEGLNLFTNMLAHGTSRADVAVMIAESPEAQQHLVNQIEQGWHLA